MTAGIGSTHGLSCEHTDEDARRKISVFRYPDNTYGVHLETWIEGRYKIDSELELTETAFNMLTDLLVEASTNIMAYPTD